jgi:hypothetical protein
MQAVGSLILGPAPQPLQGRVPTNSHPSDLHDLQWTEPLSSAKPAIHTCMISARLHPQACTGLHRPAQFCWAVPLTPAQACTWAPKAYQAGNPQTQTISTLRGPRPSGTPGPCSKGLLIHLNERPPPVGPHPPATLHRRAPNLPKRHTQTGLDAKGVNQNN